MCRQNHTFSVDFFALGVIVYELMLGKRPYHGRSRKEIRDEVLAKQAQIKKNEIPDNWSIEAADFVNRMIQRKPTSRLGHNCSDEIRRHPWLRNFPWDRLYSKSLLAPFVPYIDHSLTDHQIQVSS
jgi:serine/threonine protein kinase